MKYFLDTEFVEDGETIEPISLALVRENGSHLYIEFKFNEYKAIRNDFVRDRVLPHLKLPISQRMLRSEARDAILRFVGPYDTPEFWAYYAAYDWVLFCQLFGSMVQLPDRFPKLCLDLQQEWLMRSPRPPKPPEPTQAHNALADAYWNLALYRVLRGQP